MGAPANPRCKCPLLAQVRRLESVSVACGSTVEYSAFLNQFRDHHQPHHRRQSIPLPLTACARGVALGVGSVARRRRRAEEPACACVCAWSVLPAAQRRSDVDVVGFFAATTTTGTGFLLAPHLLATAVRSHITQSAASPTVRLVLLTLFPQPWQRRSRKAAAAAGGGCSSPSSPSSPSLLLLLVPLQQ